MAEVGSSYWLTNHQKGAYVSLNDMAHICQFVFVVYQLIYWKTQCSVFAVSTCMLGYSLGSSANETILRGYFTGIICLLYLLHKHV